MALANLIRRAGAPRQQQRAQMLRPQRPGVQRPNAIRAPSPARGPAQPNWQDRGFTSRDAAQSVGRQYGLVQNAAGEWVKPDMDFLARQMTAQGWGPDQPVATPVGIGGARWMVGPGGPQFTGQASDVPFNRLPVGNAYDATNQVPYGDLARRRRLAGGRMAGNGIGPQGTFGLPAMGGAAPQMAAPGAPPAADAGALAGTSAAPTMPAPTMPALPQLSPGAGSDPYSSYLEAAQGLTSGLPLGGPEENARRALFSQLQAQLSGLGVQRGQVQPQIDLYNERAATERARAQEELIGNLIARGVYGGGGPQREAQGALDTEFMRGSQDVAAQAAQQYADLDTQASQAMADYQAALQDLWLDLAGMQAENPSPALGAGGFTPSPTPAPVGGGGGGGGGGGARPMPRPGGRRPGGGGRRGGPNRPRRR